jgi:uncharacterized protein YprB with RNaseH-like and TPR domain
VDGIGSPTDKQQVLSDLRARLAQLGQEHRRAQDRSVQQPPRRRSPAPPTAPAPILYRRALPAAPPPRTPSAGSRLARYRVALEDAIPSGAEVSTPRGPVFEIAQLVAGVEGAQGLSDCFAEQLATPGSALSRRLEVLGIRGPLSPRRFVFADIETAGLSSAPLFLIGIMVATGGALEVKQFFARNYAEEAAAILRFMEASAGRDILVTFNGKSFDLPFIRARATVNALPFDLDPAHVDLLHESRRIWKAELPNCKLQTLERHVCGRTRHGDIPGSEIPEAYHAYVRTADAWQMVEALKHNMLDLVTLADIMTRFP